MHAVGWAERYGRVALNVERVLVRSGGWGWRRRRESIFRICKAHTWHDVTTSNQVPFKTRRAYAPVPGTGCRRSRLRCPGVVDSEKTFENEWVGLVSRYVPFFLSLFLSFCVIELSFRRPASRSPPFHVFSWHALTRQILTIIQITDTHLNI